MQKEKNVKSFFWSSKTCEKRKKTSPEESEITGSTPSSPCDQPSSSSKCHKNKRISDANKATRHFGLFFKQF